MKYPLDYLRLHSGKGRKKILTDFVDVEEDNEEELFFTPPAPNEPDQEEGQVFGTTETDENESSEGVSFADPSVEE